MRAVNSIGLVLVILLFSVTGVYINDVSAARWSDFSYDSYSFSYGGRAADMTQEAIYIMLVFVLFFTGAMIGNLVKVKTITSKVMAIIGLSFSLLILLVSFAVLSSPSHLTFDESGGFFLIYGLFVSLFSLYFWCNPYNTISEVKKNTMSKF